MTPAVAVLQKVLAAYGSQRDPINDSDLDNEQPITLTVYLNLGELRRARMAVVGAGYRPADFDTKPRGTILRDSCGIAHPHPEVIPDSFCGSGG